MKINFVSLRIVSFPYQRFSTHPRFKTEELSTLQMVLSRKAALMTNVILFTAGEVFLSILSLLFLEMAA